MDDSNRNAVTSWWREPQVLGLIVIVFLAHFYRLDVLSVRGEEPRRIAIGQDMLRTGDWIVPTIQDEPVLFRPPLQNWLIAGSIALFGQTDHWSVRLPGVTAVLLTCLMIYAYGRRFLGRVGAFSAAAAFATMVQVLSLGRLAETEAIFTCLICVTLLTWHWGCANGWPDWRLWMTAYALAGLGALAKGMQAPIYLFIASGAYLISTGQWRRFVSGAHVLGGLTFVAVFGPWFVAYAARMGLDNARLIVAGETTMRLDYRRPAEVFEHAWFYPLWVLSCMLPWCLCLPVYARRDFRASIGPAAPMVRFVALALLLSFPTCWIVPSANPRYFMPMYPCVALLIGLVIERSMEAAAGTLMRRHWTWFSTAAGVLVAVLALALLTGAPVPIPAKFLAAQPREQMLLFALTTLAAGSLVFAYRRAASAVPVFALAVVVALAGSIIFQNKLVRNSLDVESPVAALKERIPAEAPFYSFGQANHRFAFYFNRPIERIAASPEKSSLPPEGSYFCFDATSPEMAVKEGPRFAWEKIDILWMDRDAGQRESFVVVGRRIPATQIADSRVARTE